MTILSDEIQRLNQLPDEIRKQAKFDHIVELMQGETGNFSAGVYVSLMASFFLAVMQTGLDPIKALHDFRKHTEGEIRKELTKAGITTGGSPKGLHS